MEKECLIVKQDSTFNCYKTHEAYAIHENHDLGYAEDTFDAYVREAKKRSAIIDSVDNARVYEYPQHKEQNYLRRNLKERIVKKRNLHNTTREDAN